MLFALTVSKAINRRATSWRKRPSGRACRRTRRGVKQGCARASGAQCAERAREPRAPPPPSRRRREIGLREDRGLRIAVDDHDRAGTPHAHHVLGRTPDADREIETLGPLQSSDRSAVVTGLNDRAIFEQTLRIPFPYTDADADAFLMRAIEGQKSGANFISLFAMHRAN